MDAEKDPMLKLAEHVATATAARVRKDWQEEIEALRQQWADDLRQLRDDLTVQRLLSETSEASMPSTPPAVQPINVLIAEDYPDMRRVLIRSLAHAGMRVLSAMDGETGALLLKNDPSIEVVVADISMPKNGYTLLEHVRKHHSQVEVIVMSGHVTEETRAKTLGAFDFLPKPFELDRIVNAVKLAAEKYRAGKTKP